MQRPVSARPLSFAVARGSYGERVRVDLDDGAQLRTFPVERVDAR